MELRHLRYFIAVAEELHFGRAAARLHVAQPPLSRQIQSLERELGVPLFIRRNRRIELTTAGHVFLEGARRTVDAAELAARDAQRAGRGEIGRLALGFVGSATYAVLPALLHSFRTRYPDVELSLQAMTTQEQVAAFQQRSIHIGILRPPIGERMLALHTIARESLLIVLPESHPLAHSEQVRLAALADEPLILYPRADGPGIHDAIVSLCLQAGFTPRIVQEAAEMTTIAGLVAGGIGLALVLAPIAHLHSWGVVYRPVDGDVPSWELALAWRHDNISTVVRAFLSTAHEVLRETTNESREQEQSAAESTKTF